jgi:hypothetical protein
MVLEKWRKVLEIMVRGIIGDSAEKTNLSEGVVEC